MRRNSISSLFIGSAMALATLALPLPAFAQDAVQEEDESYTDIIVTAALVRQGGAQDVRHFRSVALVDGIPDSDSLTIEGLMGEHDLTMAANRPCAQTLCITASAMQASLPTRPDDKLFVGLGFSSNIAPDGWQREPLNLVAVVDKSGSMDGRPLDLVRESLLQILSQMKAGDRMGIVLYGNESHVYLEPSDVGDNRGRIAAAIRAGYTLEAPKATRHLDVVGEWKVLSVRGMDDLSRGDTVEFTEDNELITYFAKPRRGRDELTQGFEINERQIRIDDQDPLLFALDNNRLTISSFGDGAKIVMVRE